MRASDLERQRTIDELRRHCAAGRIDVDEYASRIEKALAATTLEELDHLRSDLPMMRVAEPEGGRRIWAHPVRSARPAGEPGPGPGGRPRRALAVGMAVLVAVMVVAVLILALAAQWGWAAVLAAGWAAGVATGRVSRR